LFSSVTMAPRPLYTWKLAGGRTLDLGRSTRIMGILNVTPDSFSDGGVHFEAHHAVEAGRAMLAEGADLIDVGAESTRPGSEPVPAGEEIRRVLPVVEELARLGAVVSIDTRKSAVARAALRAGAVIVNDVSGLRFDPDLAGVVAEAGAGLVLMHSRGTPHDMQANPRYHNVVSEVALELEESCARAMAANVPPESLVVDPGLGFAKTAEHNLILLRELDVLVKLGRPVLVGGSRKSFVGWILGNRPVTERTHGSLAVAVTAALLGAHIVRVHDVAPTADALSVTDAILNGLNRENENPY
jgi:dihydropteroate synthase